MWFSMLVNLKLIKQNHLKRFVCAHLMHIQTDFISFFSIEWNVFIKSVFLRACCTEFWDIVALDIVVLDTCLDTN